MKKTLLFLELPRLDNDAAGPQEHLRLAGVYLRSLLERSAESRYFKALCLPDAVYRLDDEHLLKAIARRQPDLVACTLYLWNIERSLHVLRRLRALDPRLAIIVGGPEVARYHPFLFRSHLPDIAVCGEGEAVWESLLSAWRKGRTTNVATVAWKTKRGYCWGRCAPPVLPLRNCLPSPAEAHYQPDANGMAYLETARGCPMRCTYCRYHHQRGGVSFLTADEILARVRAFQRQGAREIRFIDPSFNYNPAFEAILNRLADRSTGDGRSTCDDRSTGDGRSTCDDRSICHGLKFFAEINADRLAPHQARLLAAAHFKEIEVGVQSRNPRVLRLIRRPTPLAALDRGIRALLARKIRVTLDLMAGLPGQTGHDIRSSVAWAARLKGARVQCLQTLLLPGTDIRRERKRWKLVADDRPPYAVTATSTIPSPRMRSILACIQQQIGVIADCPTRRFVGRDLPDLFPEQIHLHLSLERWPQYAPGRQARRAIVFHGSDLFACRERIGDFIRGAVCREPHILWQFILAPEREEPLDLLDSLIAGLRKCPPHLSDRWILLDAAGRMAARRIMLWLQSRQRYDQGWVKAANALLRSAFY
ncbi:MAG: radical SAM protein [Kiritimatiellaeota bacterium]|nr:radical SAM protein [Kiritimatiellota bacterium]